MLEESERIILYGFDLLLHSESLRSSLYVDFGNTLYMHVKRIQLLYERRRKIKTTGEKEEKVLVRA